MNRIRIIKLRALAFMLFLNGLETVAGQNARMRFYTDRKIGEVDKNLYGNLVEHLGGYLQRHPLFV